MYGYGYRACRNCGATVQKKVLDAEEHECDPGRLEAYQVSLVRRELEHLEDELEAHLRTPAGAFHLYLARRP